MFMGHPDALAALLEEGRRVLCSCGGSLLRERLSGRPGTTVVAVECSQCDKRFRVGRQDGAEPVMHLPSDLVPEPAKQQVGCMPRVPRRPHCLVKSCLKLASEAGLCLTHHILWKREGIDRPSTQAWAAAQQGGAREIRPTLKPAPVAATQEAVMPRRQTWEHGTFQEQKAWIRAGKPPVEQWIAAGRPGKRGWVQWLAKQGQGEPATAAPAPAKAKPAADDWVSQLPKPTPAVAATEPAQVPVALMRQLILPGPTCVLLVGRVGQYVTIAGADGAVLLQLRI